MRSLVFLCLLSACAHSNPGSSRELIQNYRQSGNYAQAFETAKAGVCEHPSDILWVGEYAQAWSDLNHPGSIDALVATCPLSNISKVYLRALAHASLKEFSIAKTQFKSLLSGLEKASLSEQDKAEVYYRAGLVSVLAQDFPAALRSLAIASVSMPLRVDIRLAQAQAELSLKHYSKAAQSLFSILVLNPNTSSLVKARRLLQKGWALAEGPLPSDIQVVLQNYLSSLERGQPNSDALRQLISLSEEHSHSRVFTVAGMVALRLGAQKNAHQLLVKASELNLFSPDPLRILGTSYAASNQWVKAFEPLKEAAKRNPFDPAVLSILAKVALHLNENDVAAEQYKLLVILEPQRSLHLLHLARAQRKLEKYAIARKVIKAGIELELTIPLVLEWAVIEAEHYQACTDPGVKSDAKAGVQEAVSQLLELSPKHPAAKALLASLE